MYMRYTDKKLFIPYILYPPSGKYNLSLTRHTKSTQCIQDTNYCLYWFQHKISLSLITNVLL